MKKPSTKMNEERLIEWIMDNDMAFWTDVFLDSIKMKAHMITPTLKGHVYDLIQEYVYYSDLYDDCKLEEQQ